MIFLYKNYKLQATEQPGPRLEDQSWIADPSEEPESMDMEGGQVGAGQVGAGQVGAGQVGAGQVGAGPEKKDKENRIVLPRSRN